MEFDLVEALIQRLQQQHPSASPNPEQFSSLKVTALAVNYVIISSLPSGHFRSLLRVRSRNQTNFPQRHSINAHVPESFSVELIPIRWPEPVEVKLPPPPRVERVAIRAHAGAEASRKGRRPLRAQLMIPPDTEMLSELSYRPLALQGTVNGIVRVQGRLSLQTPNGEILRLLDESFAVELGPFSALGIDEVLLEDRESLPLGPLREVRKD